MPRYMISFERGSMDHIPEGDWGKAGKDARAVVREAKDAGVYITSGGLDYDNDDVEAAVVAVDGLVTDGPYPEGKEAIGGLLIVEVPTREDAMKWAAKVAVACRCAQDVRKFMYDPEV